MPSVEIAVIGCIKPSVYNYSCRICYASHFTFVFFSQSLIFMQCPLLWPGVFFSPLPLFISFLLLSGCCFWCCPISTFYGHVLCCNFWLLCAFFLPSIAIHVDSVILSILCLSFALVCIKLSVFNFHALSKTVACCLHQVCSFCFSPVADGCV